MRLTGAEIKIVLDSRGQETLAAVLESGVDRAEAAAPSGKSRGRLEMFIKEPRGAVQIFNKIRLAFTH